MSDAASSPLLRGRGPYFLLLLLLSASLAQAAPPPDHLRALQRGVAITGWFRFPSSADPAALRAYLPDSAMADLRRAGFTFVRLPVQPEFLAGSPERLPLLVEAVRRLQRAGLAVVIDAHPTTWQLEIREADRTALLVFWRTLAPALRPLAPRLTFPELLNEPVFPNAPDQWAALQDTLLHAVRADLPDDTVVLTGNDWGSIGGLTALRPAADPNVVYSFHFYEPAELTALAAYRQGLDRAALARLPFPVRQPACDLLAASTDPDTGGVIRFYCTLHWGPSRIADRIAAATAWGRRNHAALLLGEFGVSAALAPLVRTAWLRAVRQACEAGGIGWALWGYDDIMGFAVTRPPGPHPMLQPDLLRALGLHTPS